MCNIALYSIRLYFYHLSHPQLSVVFALARWAQEASKNCFKVYYNLVIGARCQILLNYITREEEWGCYPTATFHIHTCPHWVSSSTFDLPSYASYSFSISAYHGTIFQNHHFVVSKFVSNFGLVLLKCLPGCLLPTWSFVNIHRYEEGWSLKTVLISDS